MIEAVAAHGYAGASVAKVIALAGVSRSTFYEQFADRQACFLATFEIVVARAIKHVNAAYRGERDWVKRMEGAFDAFAREVAEHPKAARLALVEALGAGPEALQSMERVSGVFERIIASSFERSPSGVRLPSTIVRGIVGAIARVTRARLTEDRSQELPALAGELRAWVLAYDSPAVERLRVTAPADGSRRERSAPVSRAGEDERTHILLAAGKLAARGGYASLGVGQIVEDAGVSHESFRAHFHSVEECFLAACDLIGERSLAAIFEESLPARDWPHAVYRASTALLGRVASDRVFARLAFVEIFAAGPAGLPSRRRLMNRGAALLRERAPASERVSEIAAEAIMGGLFEIVRNHVVREQARLLPSLVEHTAYFVLAPAIGADAAVQHILAARESAALPGGAPENHEHSLDTVSRIRCNDTMS
jgi:AcrR family transcriptional regulator